MLCTTVLVVVLSVGSCMGIYYDGCPREKIRIPDKNFPDVRFIENNAPITNVTMYVMYPNLWRLDMSNQTKYEFPANRPMLVHMELSRFVCHNCGVHSIYSESLTHLPQLTHLLMENNSIQYVHQDAFKCNERLDKLNLAGNKLITFNADATLQFLPDSWTTLDLSRNRKFDLNRVNFTQTRLFFFKCDYCLTTFLDRNTLVNMPQLRSLSLRYNVLERIDDDAFASAKYLRRIFVNGNENLRRLNLVAPTIRVLSAEKCNLRGKLNTSSLPALTYINVRGNELTTINEFGFLANPNIETILLDNNYFRKIPATLLEMQNHLKLKRLCLDRNPIQPSSRVDETVFLYRAKSLRKDCLDDGQYLKQFENYLTTSTGMVIYTRFHYTAYSPSIDFSRKNIVYIEPDYLVNAGEDVKELLFDNNHLFDFKPHRVFLDNAWIERLSLGNCSITEIYEATFRKLPALRTIYLQDNKIESIISAVFLGNPNLQLLNLTHNRLKWIETYTFSGLKNLHTLLLDWNNLSDGGDAPFLTSMSLRKLSCTHCKFKQLGSNTLTGLPNLVKLNLDNNYIVSVKSDALRNTPRLESLYLRHNPLVMFEPNIGNLNLKTLCLPANGDTVGIDLTHWKNKHLLKNVERMKELDTNCNGFFSYALEAQYKRKRHTANEIIKKEMYDEIMEEDKYIYEYEI